MNRNQYFELYQSCIVPGFSDIMINQLARHNSKGDSWTDCEPAWLLKRAKQELKELEDALNALTDCPDSKELNRIARECADVSNFMMMIADSIDAI